MSVRASSILPAMAKAAAKASALESVHGCPYLVGLAASKNGSSRSPPLLRVARRAAREQPQRGTQRARDEQPEEKRRGAGMITLSGV